MKKLPHYDLWFAYINAFLLIILILGIAITLAWCVHYAVSQARPINQVWSFLSLIGFLLIYLIQRLERIVEFICKLTHIHELKPKSFEEHERLLGKIKLPEGSSTKDFMALFLSIIEGARKNEGDLP